MAAVGAVPLPDTTLSIIRRIDCAVCVPECPVNAIYAEEDVPQDQLEFVMLNRELAKAWPTISKKVAPAPDADEWAKVVVKKQHLDRG